MSLRRIPNLITSRGIAFGSWLLLCLAIGLARPPESFALVFQNESTEPTETIPPDFPYWDHVTQRRHGGPTVIYLGGGWALTARHVGYGEIILGGMPTPPERGMRHTLMNPDGTIADAVVFPLKQGYPLPDLPLLKIATRAPRAGDEILMIGFGRLRGDPIEWGPPGNRKTAFGWTEDGEKRWGTNRVVDAEKWLRQSQYRTISFSTYFDAVDDENSTAHEASATVGDSGGAIFMKQDGQWLLVGLINSVGTAIARPSQSTATGDITYSADLTHYRAEILHWARPDCSNEVDDDGDGLIDYPEDPKCENPEDPNERPEARMNMEWRTWGWAVVPLILGSLAIVWGRQRQRTLNTPDSMSSSSAR